MQARLEHVTETTELIGLVGRPKRRWDDVLVDWARSEGKSTWLNMFKDADEKESMKKFVNFAHIHVARIAPRTVVTTQEKPEDRFEKLANKNLGAGEASESAGSTTERKQHQPSMTQAPVEGAKPTQPITAR